jgi:quinol monooxygenase YgiN
MTFATVDTLDTRPGQRDALVALLTRRSDRVAELGCLLYEVGVDAEAPDTVFVVELWTSREAHRASLEDEGVRAAIAEARPMLAGTFGGFRFDVAGSPLHG